MKTSVPRSECVTCTLLLSFCTKWRTHIKTELTPSDTKNFIQWFYNIFLCKFLAVVNSML